jgi:hypothetical protein
MTLAGLISAWLRIWFISASIGGSEIGHVCWDSFFWLSHQEKYCRLKQDTTLAAWLLTISLFLAINAVRVTSMIKYKIICKSYDKLQDIISSIWFIVREEMLYKHMPDYQPLYRLSLLTFHDAVPHCMVSFLINHIYAYTYLWQTLFPRIYFLSNPQNWTR